MNKERVIIIILGALLSIVLQLWVSPMIAILTYRVDFILIFVILAGLRMPRKMATLTGFIMGGLQDFMGAATFPGLLMLSKTIVGFAAGSISKFLSRQNEIFTSFTLIGIVMVHFFIYLWIYFQSTHLSLFSLLLTHDLPLSIYNSIFLLLFYFLLRGEEI